MKTIVLEKPGTFVRTETEGPAPPAPGQVQVRVHRIGICGTDLHAFRGRQPYFNYPRIVGHELGVEVIQAGQGVDHLSPGDRCAVEPYLNCGACIACRYGKTNCCTSLQVLGVHVDGGMREAFTVPADKLHRSDKLTFDQLALVEMLGIGAHAVDRASLTPGECVLVIGVGPIGLSVLQFAQVAGAKVIVLELNAHRMAFCRRHFHVEHGIDGKGDVLAELQEYLSGDLPTAVFDVTGNAKSMASAYRYMASGGRLVLVGLVQDDITFHDPEFHRREMTLLCSRNARGEDFSRIIRHIENGQVNTDSWITHRAGFGDMIEQFPTWLEPEQQVVKAVVSV